MRHSACSTTYGSPTYISPEHPDALHELLNIGVRRSAGSLNQKLGKPIRLHISLIQSGKIEDLFQDVQMWRRRP